MQYLGSFPRDANRVPDVANGLLQDTTKVLVGNNATVVVPIFTIVGSVECKGIWAVVETVLGANHTAAAFRLNDGTNQSDITLNTGVTLSAAPVGSLVVKKDKATAAATLVSATQEQVSEPTTLETVYFSPFTLTAKNAVTTNIEYRYTTTDTPTSGQLHFFLRWLPLSVNANVLAL